MNRLRFPWLPKGATGFAEERRLKGVIASGIFQEYRPNQFSTATEVFGELEPLLTLSGDGFIESSHSGLQQEVEARGLRGLLRDHQRRQPVGEGGLVRQPLLLQPMDEHPGVDGAARQCLQLRVDVAVL